MTKLKLATTPHPTDFSCRHIGSSPADVIKMLDTLGVSSIDELIEQAIPRTIRQHAPLDIGAAMSETEALHKLRSIGSRNKVLIPLIGQGYYGTILPPVI